MCWEGPFSPTRKSWWGEAGGFSKGHYIGGKSSGGRSQLFLHVLPKQQNWGGGDTQEEEEQSLLLLGQGQRKEDAI